MKKSLLMIALIGTSCTLITGCNRNNNGKGISWNEDQTSRNAHALFGKESQESNLIASSHEDFISLKDADLKGLLKDGAFPQPPYSPGEPGSGLPGLEQFHTPSGIEASIFRTLYFNTDDHILRSQESLAAIDRIAAYLKNHPDTYLFISGNCDERGPEGYNLSLGARRANYIRSKLAEQGVDPNRLHTVSYGKEKPIDLGHNQEAWAKNRRAEFKIYQRS